jgi:hypothetical protein
MGNGDCSLDGAGADTSDYTATRNPQRDQEREDDRGRRREGRLPPRTGGQAAVGVAKLVADGLLRRMCRERVVLRGWIYGCDGGTAPTQIPFLVSYSVGEEFERCMPHTSRTLRGELLLCPAPGGPRDGPVVE